MKVAALVIVLVFVFAEATKWHELESYSFDDYQKEFTKSYSTDNEKNFRKMLFEKKLVQIKQHNSDPTKTWKQGVNKFTDRTDEEFRRLLGARKEFLTPYHTEAMELDVSHLEQSSVDWRTKGIITSVKDQGECGSCWSFGSAETLESYWANATGQLVVLSEQQILDCTPNSQQCGGTGGCEGGTAEIAYTQIQKQGGLATEWTYPYISYLGDNYKCQFSQSNTPPYARVSGYVNLPSNQYAPILQHLAQNGPLVINVDASSWSSYESGVYNGCDSSKNVDIDHVVQLVGYGTDSNYGDYWLIRNSWSPKWGELGYMRLIRSSKPECGIDNTPGDGTGCQGGPSQVTVCGACGILYDALFPIVKAN